MKDSAPSQSRPTLREELRRAFAPGVWGPGVPQVAKLGKQSEFLIEFPVHYSSWKITIRIAGIWVILTVRNRTAEIINSIDNVREHEYVGAAVIMYLVHVRYT